MKQKSVKRLLIFTAIIIIIIMLLMVGIFFPTVSDKVGETIGKSGATVRNFSVTVLTLAVGALFGAWGIAIIPVAPVIGVGLVLVGVAMIGWALWTSGWFTSTVTTNNGLEKMF